jgi:hypothetical protein
MSLFWWIVMGFDCERVGLVWFLLFRGLGGGGLFCSGSKWLIPMGVDEFA